MGSIRECNKSKPGMGLLAHYPCLASPNCSAGAVTAVGSWTSQSQRSTQLRSSRSLRGLSTCAYTPNTTSSVGGMITMTRCRVRLISAVGSRWPRAVMLMAGIWRFKSVRSVLGEITPVPFLFREEIRAFNAGGMIVRLKLRCRI